MNDFERHITKATENVRLSDDQKARMHNVLQSYMRFSPLPVPKTRTARTVSWIMLLHRPIAAALVLVLVTGSGVSYAAQSALPGDVLYNVKTGVNEPLAIALAGEGEAKAEAQLSLAERRIEEATTLAAEGRLDEDTSEKLAIAFEVHAKAAVEAIEEAEEGEEASISPVFATRFEARLSAREMILAEVETHEVAHKSGRLPVAIRDATIALSEKRARRTDVSVAPVAEDAVSTTMAVSLTQDTAPETMSMKAALPTAPAPTPSVDEKTIDRMKAAAEKSLKTAEKYLKNTKRLSSVARERAVADIDLARQLIQDAEAMQETAPLDAFATFQSSLQTSENALVYMKAAPLFDRQRVRNEEKNDRASHKESEARDEKETNDDKKDEDEKREEDSKHDENEESDNESEREQDSNDTILKLDISL